MDLTLHEESNSHTRKLCLTYVMKAYSPAEWV